MSAAKVIWPNDLAQHDYVDYFQSFAKSRERGLPSRLPADREQPIRRDSQLLEFETKSTSTQKRAMGLLHKSKRPKAKPMVIELASSRRACSNINSNGTGGGGTAKLRAAKGAVMVRLYVIAVVNCVLVRIFFYIAGTGNGHGVRGPVRIIGIV